MRRGTIITPSAPVEILEGGSATLSPGKEFWVTAPTKLTLARSARAGDRLVVVNNTEGDLTISGQNLSGVDRSGAFVNQSAVRLAANGEAQMVRSRRGWRVRGCDRGGLLFAYNGTPLSINNRNPDGASDLFHYLGGVGSYTNPTTNGTVAAAQSSRDSSYGSAIVTSDRVANPATTSQVWLPNNIANSWIAWEFPALFQPTGLLLQTNGVANTYHIRSFELRYSNDTGTALTSSAPVATWTQGTGWANQNQITGIGAWFYFPITGMPQARRWAIRMTGPDSSGNQWQAIAEINWFGLYVV